MVEDYTEVIGADLNRDIRKVIKRAREIAYYRMLDHGLTIAAVALVCIRLGCEGPNCINQSAWNALNQPHLTPAQEVWNLFEIG